MLQYLEDYKHVSRSFCRECLQVPLSLLSPSLKFFSHLSPLQMTVLHEMPTVLDFVNEKKGVNAEEPSLENKRSLVYVLNCTRKYRQFCQRKPATVKFTCIDNQRGISVEIDRLLFPLDALISVAGDIIANI